jgi:NAD(P)-dependent dehydrogenase (short-subunit alcohol dehydrogenase family)
MTKTWFITGTSTGFGRELTEQLLARGDRVAATLRWPALLNELANQYGANLWVRELDVTKTTWMREVVNGAFDELGRVDIVVSNAAYRLLGAAEELSDQQIARQIDTNVVGSVQLARAVMPHLRAQGGGRIIQISGMCGQIGLPGLSLYTLTRWALEGFYESFGPEVAAFGVHTCLVEPGNSRNQFASRSSVVAPPRDEYVGTPAGLTRDQIREQRTTDLPGELAKIARAIIDVADGDKLPQRLVLGSDAYGLVRAALAGRLASVEAQKQIAFSTDARDFSTDARDFAA